MQTNLVTDSYQELSDHSAMSLLSKKRHPEFAARFREILKDKSWADHTRKDLGKMLGVSASLVTYWWNGDRLPTVEQAAKLGEIFDCQVEWLLTGKGQKRFTVDITDEKHYRILQALKSAQAAIEQDGSQVARDNELVLYRFAIERAMVGVVSDSHIKSFIEMLSK